MTSSPRVYENEFFGRTSTDFTHDLIEKAGGTVVGFSFVMRLDGLDGLDKLDGKPSSSLIAMPA